MPHRHSLTRTLLLSGLCALLSACGSPVNQANFERIQTGMTLEEVQAILGKPTESASAGFGPISAGATTWEHDGTVIAVQFVNQKVQFKQFTDTARK